MIDPPKIWEPGEFVHSLTPWFEQWRSERRERYASRPTPEPGARSRAVITIAYNEPVFFPIWLDYYSRFFAPEDIYVVDHGSTDGSLDGEGFVRIPCERTVYDLEWLLETMRHYQHELIERYDMVMTTDVDEIIAPLPSWGTLDAYLDRFDESWVNPIGYELVHLPDREPPYDPTRPVLDQRRYWFANDAYNKPALATKPMDWILGFHDRTDNNRKFDPDLRLIHLHRLDYELCLRRHEQRRRGGWREDEANSGLIAHYRHEDREEFDRWFFHSSGVEELGIKMCVEEIPAEFRGLF